MNLLLSRSAMFFFAASVVVGCSGGAGSDQASTEDALVLGGGKCPVTTCAGAGCSSFTSGGEYVPASGLASMHAPTTVIPDVPLIQRQLRVGDGSSGKWLRPSIPPQRTTADGRVGVTQGAHFVSMKLELLRDRPVMRSPKDLGDAIEGNKVTMTFADGTPVMPSDLAPSSKWNLTDIVRADATPEVTICEDQPHQPTACPNLPGGDCYDVKLIQHVEVTTPDRHVHLGLESIPIRIRVKNAKTPQAEVDSVVVGDKSQWVRAQLAPFSSFDEGLNTRDGHLLVGRMLDENNLKVGKVDFNVTIDYLLSDQKTHTQAFSLAYAYAKDACDVTEWMEQKNGVFQSLRPLSAAPYDPRINGNGGGEPLYGIAARPFRDSFGNVIPETSFLAGSYPWVDKEGRNVVFSTVNPDLFANGDKSARWPLLHTSNAEKLGTVGGTPRGFAVVGNWTEGKTVMLDDMINNDDSGIFPDDEYELGLYQSGGNPVAVRVNGGGKLDTSKLGLQDAVANNHHIDSTENMTAMHTASAAVTPRDVVWTISRGLNSDEVPFDDYIDPHVVLFAEMNAAWKRIPGSGRSGELQDGFSMSQDGTHWVHDPSAIRLQNSATSPVYSIASPGEIDGDGRVEPVASGGVQGRGLWLEPGSDAHWDFPPSTTTTVGNAGFFAGVFVDARESMKGTKHVFSLVPTSGTPTEITVTDGALLAVTRGTDVASFDVSCSAKSWNKTWHHVGALFESDGTVTVFLDGNPLGTKTFATPVRLEPGQFLLGGIRGWYDEARVVVNGSGNQLTEAASVELLCNYARGTMVAAGKSSPLFADAAAAPSIAARIAALGAATGPSGTKMICATDYAGYTDGNHGYSLGVNYTPPSTTSMRASILLEGTKPLRYDAPRPDSRQRSFCRGCHVSTNEDAMRTSTLSLKALTANGDNADVDPRTQPSQPSLMPGDAVVRAWGVIPVGWIDTPDGKSLPASERRGADTLLLDYVFR